MEARVEYLGRVERPRLTVVKDGAAQGRFSALPHDIIRKSSISRDARLLVAVLQMYGWEGADITASHATLAADMDCSTRMLRQYLDELIEARIITERDAGVRRQKVYRLVSIGSTVPIEPHNSEKQASDWTGCNRKFSTGQSEVFDSFNRKQASDSKKKTPVKKTKEEDGVPELVVSGGVDGADRATAAATDAKKSGKVPFGSLSDDARRVVDDWREKQGRTRPPQLNPAQAAYLEDAVADLGVDRLLEANTWAAQNAVPELVKAIRAARTKRQRDEEHGGPSTPHANGTAATLVPATDADRAIWAKALEIVGGRMRPDNVANYLGPLVVGGRVESGGLCLIVPPDLGEHLKGFRNHISRALEDAGDPAPRAVAFKARRVRGQTDAE